jgi:hypothetical protein
MTGTHDIAARGWVFSMHADCSHKELAGAWVARTGRAVPPAAEQLLAVGLDPSARLWILTE